MAGYGSAGRPVNLGPFRRIVGVHWRDDDVTHVAFRMRVQWVVDDISFFDEGIEPPRDHRWPPPEDYDDGTYFASAAFRYYGGSILVGPAFTNPQAFIGGEWTDAGLNVTGLPIGTEAPDFTWGRVPLSPGQRSAGFRVPKSMHWINPSGDELPIKAPGVSGRFFRSGSAGIEMFCASYSGGKESFWDGGIHDPVWMYQITGSSALVIHPSFPSADVAVEYRGYSFRPIGSVIVPSALGLLHMPRDSGDSTNPGELWVLCERINDGIEP